MVSEHRDRRVRRTHGLLWEALIALTLEKGYDKVRVRDVLDRADVGRATFYTHFRDKDDLLLSGAEEFRQSFRQHLALAARAVDHRAGDGINLAGSLFEHAAAHRPLYRALMRSRAGQVVLTYAREQLATLLRQHLDDVVTSRRATPTVPVEVMVQYLASAVLGMLTWWLDSDTAYSAEEMGRALALLTEPTFATVAGARP